MVPYGGTPTFERSLYHAYPFWSYTPEMFDLTHRSVTVSRGCVVSNLFFNKMSSAGQYCTFEQTGSTMSTKGLPQLKVVLFVWLALTSLGVEAFLSPSHVTRTKNDNWAIAGCRHRSDGRRVFTLRSTMVEQILTWQPLSNAKDLQSTQSTEITIEDDNYDKNLLISFAIPPILAFLFWGQLSSLVAYLTDLMGFPGQNVDGNAFANNLLRPTINGVVVPASGIGLGTLFATTVNVLWNRQLMLQTKINTEVCELRHLRRALFGCFGTAQHSNRRHTALSLVLQYTRALMAETQVGSIDRLEEIQMTHGIAKNELDGTCGVLRSLHLKMCG
jgi:hypothetical protein